MSVRYYVKEILQSNAIPFLNGQLKDLVQSLYMIIIHKLSLQ